MTAQHGGQTSSLPIRHSLFRGADFTTTLRYQYLVPGSTGTDGPAIQKMSSHALHALVQLPIGTYLLQWLPDYIMYSRVEGITVFRLCYYRWLYSSIDVLLT